MRDGGHLEYGKPPFYLLEDAVECWVVSARDVKIVLVGPRELQLGGPGDCLGNDGSAAAKGVLRPEVTATREDVYYRCGTPRVVERGVVFTNAAYEGRPAPRSRIRSGHETGHSAGKP